ncbi:MAG: prephenate dehydrogenase/arogenate dehydrogenase family protein, partial [Candidatus Marinimicrobia bacterium]|nr:prephenate dehydrogenase/arogenate dehydrogenase family protein [Candidatus Neomarinimicrobiota bacterium]
PGKNIKKATLEEVLEKDVIFLCIPISSIEFFLKENRDKINPSATVIDTASVKVYPVRWMDEYIPYIPHLGIHPLFGPDSYAINRVNLIILTPSEQYPNLAKKWRDIFQEWHFFTRILTPDEHDKSIAESQGLTHFIGNILLTLNLPETKTPTKGYGMLRAVEEFCSNDTHQLFHDMLMYNDHSSEMFRAFMKATHSVASLIRKESFNGQKDKIRIGAMGDEGSFSHEAALQFIKEKQIANGEVLCLTTAENVLDYLELGKIDIGLMPIQNAVGGVVQETLTHLARTQCKISGHFPFLVKQCLLAHLDFEGEPAAIHSHSQALRQCKSFLNTHYPNIPQIEECDTAAAAAMLARGEIPKNAFVIAPETCAKLYNLKLIQSNIQDLDYNITDFITVIIDD